MFHTPQKGCTHCVMLTGCTCSETLAFGDVKPRAQIESQTLTIMRYISSQSH